jgi:hypothetical protein
VRHAALRDPLLAMIVLLGAGATANAQAPVASREPPPRPPPMEPRPAAPPPEPVAADVVAAPRPNQSGGRIDPGDGGDSGTRLVARAVLRLPLLGFEIVTLPIRGAVYAYDRFEVERRWNETLYSRDRTRAVIPIATYQTSYGITAGARFYDKDLYDQNERLVLQASGGTAYRVELLGSIDSGERLGPLRLELGGNFDRRPAEPFFGIGNGDDTNLSGSEPMLVDPTTDTTAIHTYTRYQEGRGTLYADWSIVSNIHLGARGSLTDLKFEPSTRRNPSIEEVYDPTTVVGFQDGVRHVYGEAELSWDSRRRASRWEPASVHGTGSLATVFAGAVHNISGEGGDFVHYGTELQHYMHLGRGPRVLIPRFHGEAVTGNLDEVPFTELPMLGGDAFLRGYSHGRFRDRLAGVASLQYMWNLSLYSEAFVFVDAGRVYRNYSDVTLQDLRVGYGLGIQLHTVRDFLMDAHIASSSDGGVVVTAAFFPVLDARPRWR